MNKKKKKEKKTRVDILFDAHGPWSRFRFKTVSIYMYVLWRLYIVFIELVCARLSADDVRALTFTDAIFDIL